MTLSIEISTLRGLNEVVDGYGINRADMIALAEFVANAMDRARSEALSRSTPPVSSPGFVDCDPETQISQPEGAISRPVAPVSQPPADPPWSEPETRSARKDGWTSEQDSKLIELRSTNASIADIAKQIGRTESAVLARLQKIKTARPGTCGFGRVWTADEDARLIHMRHEGKTWGAIAAELNRTSRSTNQRYLRLKKQGAVPQQADQMPEPKPEPEKLVVDAAPAPVVFDRGPSSRRVANLGDLSQLKNRQRLLVIHLANLNEDFEPIDDLDIIEGLGLGKTSTAIADDLGCRPDDVTKRWRAMLTEDVVNRNGTPTIDGQEDLLVAARHLVKCVEDANA